MKLYANLKRLSGEFLVIFISVAVALAADNWRERLSEGATEQEYLSRLLTDLEQGKAAFELELGRLEPALDASNFLIAYLENPGSIVDTDSLVRKFSESARTGVGYENWRNDTTYQELISTGNLNLISDTNLRSQIGGYYANVYALIERRSQMSDKIWVTYRKLTGSNAGTVLGRDIEFDNSTYERILMELQTNTDLVEEYRLLKTQLENIVFRLDAIVENNNILMESISS